MTVDAPSLSEVAARRADVERAMADMFAHLPGDVRQNLRLEVHEVGTAVLVVNGAARTPMLNRVLNLGVGADATEAQVEEIREVYRRAGVPFMVQLNPLAQPAQLPAWLEERGIRQENPWAIFTRDLTPPPDGRTDLRVEPVTREQVNVFARIYSAGFGMSSDMDVIWAAFAVMPGSFSYLAWDGDTPVAAASMLISGRTARLTGAATLPEHRRRGAQGALLARRIRDAADANCDLLTVETANSTPQNPDASYQNMLRLGFRLAYLQSKYVHPGPQG